MAVNPERGRVRLRVRWADEDGTREVRAEADTTTRTVTVALPDGTGLALDVVAARALSMALHAAVYDALAPDGPFLRVEKPAPADERGSR